MARRALGRTWHARPVLWYTIVPKDYIGAFESNESRGRLFVTIIPLDRRFVEWRDPESPPPDLRFGSAYGLLSWENLLAKRRVVVLAEAGSGKTAEMEEQASPPDASWKVRFPCDGRGRGPGKP